MTQAFATAGTDYVHKQKTEKAQALLDSIPEIGARELPPLSNKNITS